MKNVWRKQGGTPMPKPRKDNPELEKMVRDRRKKFVRYEEVPNSEAQKVIAKAKAEADDE